MRSSGRDGAPIHVERCWRLVRTSVRKRPAQLSPVLSGPVPQNGSVEESSRGARGQAPARGMTTAGTALSQTMLLNQNCRAVLSDRPIAEGIASDRKLLQQPPTGASPRRGRPGVPGLIVPAFWRTGLLPDHARRARELRWRGRPEARLPDRFWRYLCPCRASHAAHSAWR